MKRKILTKKRSVYIACSAVALLVFAVAANAISLPTPGTVTKRPSSVTTNPEGTPSEAIQAKFGVFRTPEEPSGRLIVANDSGDVNVVGTPALGASTAATLGIDSAQTHLVSDGTTDIKLWLASASDNNICFLPLPEKGAAGVGASCGTEEEALSGELLGSVEYGNGSVDLFGLVPDGVTQVTVTPRNGAKLEPHVAKNVFQAHVEGAVESVSYERSSGPILIPYSTSKSH